jgi:hypothetical protein
MKLAQLSVLFAFGVLCAGPAAASDYNAGLISNVLSLNNGMIFFNQSGARGATPTCATQQRWVINATTIQGQAMLSALLSFEARGRQISVHGTGACSDWGDTESVSYIQEL